MGPDIEVGSKQALAIDPLAIHEAKHQRQQNTALFRLRAARSASAGREKDDCFFHVYFGSRQRPPGFAPTKRGFGSRMIEPGTRGYFQGRWNLSYDPEGLHFKAAVAPRLPDCCSDIPVLLGRRKGFHCAIVFRNLHGLPFLFVEDEPLLRMDAVDMIGDAGFSRTYEACFGRLSGWC